MSESRGGIWVTTTTILHDLQDYENDDAWERFVARFRHPIEAFVRRVGVASEDCEDVAQNSLLAFAEGFRRGDYNREKGRLSSWLFGIAFRQALQQRRKSARHRAVEPLTNLDAPDEDSAWAVWDRLWNRFVLEKGLAQARSEFTEATFRAFERVVFGDEAPAKVAETLGVPVKTVYNAKHRVLQRVRELMHDLELADPP